MARSQKLGQIKPTTRNGQVNSPQKERESITTPKYRKISHGEERNEKAERIILIDGKADIVIEEGPRDVQVNQ